MALKDAIQDIMNRIATGSIQFVRVWNNQLNYMESQQIEAFPMPSAFVEILNPVDHQQLSVGYTGADLLIRVHVVNTEYDAMDGTMGQNLNIFDLRDEVIGLLTYYKPTSCGNLMKVAEQQDYEHTNVYHYTIDFTTHFIDTSGAQDRTNITKEPPTDLVVEAELINPYMK